MLNRRWMLASASVGLLGALSGSASAQAWPSRPVTMIVPFPPGGSADTIARILADRLRTVTGGSFIVENRPGATGNIGVAMAAKAPPDGHTLLVATSGPVATNVLTFRNLLANPITDLEPIALLAEISGVIAVRKSLPVNNLKELLILGS
jgi:tripartite-type tricarboxylate transporter receptor subunit TctC